MSTGLVFPNILKECASSTARVKGFKKKTKDTVMLGNSNHIAEDLDPHFMIFYANIITGRALLIVM
jgi:hypothetical protein